ncbi:hypothetical protein GY45DRAFT_1179756 [Cubamyces sp. BRFM 1775]|nr:hypothetical protein GY45DRAFT_1179756 [Cubamyces sp. BRFM 1775]
MDFDNSTGLPSLDDTFGAVLIGSFVGFAIYGLSVHHAYRYFRFYPEDAIVLKALVTWVMTLETLSAVLSLHACYHYVVSSYFEPAQLVYGIWSLSIYPLLSGIIMVSSQGYFARRVWIRFLTAATAMACIVATWNQYYGVTWLLSTGYTTAVVADSIVTGLLIYVLHCNRTGVKRTDSMIDIMILFVLRRHWHRQQPIVCPHTSGRFELSHIAQTAGVSKHERSIASFHGASTAGDS